MKKLIAIVSLMCFLSPSIASAAFNYYGFNWSASQIINSEDLATYTIDSESVYTAPAGAPSPSPIWSPTPTATPALSTTPTLTSTPTPAQRSTLTPTPTPTPTSTPTPAPRSTPTPTPTPPTPPTPIPIPPNTPSPPGAQKLNTIAPGSGDFYGATISIAAGEVRTYILPLGEVYPSQNLSRLLVKSAALIDGTGQVSAKLISPDAPPWSTSGSSSTADFTFNAIAQSYPMGVNYPATYLNKGYWILEITGVQASQLKLWWKCYSE